MSFTFTINVKPLTFSQINDPNNERYAAHFLTTTYIVYRDTQIHKWVAHNKQRGFGWFDKKEDAFEACNKNFEEAILSYVY